MPVSPGLDALGLRRWGDFAALDAELGLTLDGAAPASIPPAPRIRSRTQGVQS